MALSVSARFDNMYTLLKNAIVDKTINASSIMGLVASAMKVVQGFPELIGPEKKDIVINLIRRVISDLPLDELDRENIKMFIDFTLPSVIDNIISATKGNFFGKIKDKAKSKGWSCCATETPEE